MAIYYTRVSLLLVSDFDFMIDQYFDNLFKGIWSCKIQFAILIPGNVLPVFAQLGIPYRHFRLII